MSIDHNADDDVFNILEIADNCSSAPPAAGSEHNHPETVESAPPNHNQLRESKPFACNLCKAGFSRIDHLARHFRSHTNTKPFQCEICNKGFSRQSLLVRHKLNHARNNTGVDVPSKERPTRRARACKACIRCAESKLRCEGVDPCERCCRRGVPCRYESKTKSRHLAGRSPISTVSPSEREVDNGIVIEHVETLEKMTTMVVDSPTGRPVVYGDEQPQMELQGGGELNQQSYTMDFESSLIFGDFCNSASTTSDAWSENDHASSFMDFLNENAPDPAAGLDFHVVDDETLVELSPPTEHLYTGYPSFQLNCDNKSPKPSYIQATVQTSKAETVLPDPPEIQDGFLKSPLHWRQLSTDEWNSPPTLHSSGSFEKLIPPSRWPSKALSTHPALQASTRNRLIATILSLSDNHHLAHILSCFPSLELLNNLIDNYFAVMASETDSWLHVPTFDPNTELPELVLAAVTAGALQPNVPELKQLGLAVWDINFCLGSRLFTEDNRTTALLSHLQALTLQLDLGLWGGDRRLVEMSEALSMSGITMTRRAGFLRRETLTFDLPQHDDSSEVTAAKWRKWVKYEASKRLALHILIRDAQSSMALAQSSILCYMEYSIPLPSSRDLWSAKSSEAWKRAYLSKDCHKINSLPSLNTSADDLTIILSYIDEVDMPLTSLAILSALNAHTFQYAQRSRSRNPSAPRTTSLLLSSLYQETRDRLESFNATFMDCTREDLEPATRVIYEHQLMSLHVSIEDLQCFAGKEGVARAREVTPGLTAWAGTKEGRQAVWHAGQLVAAVKGCENSKAREGTAVAVMHATLVFWAFAALQGEEKRKVISEVDTRLAVVKDVAVDGLDGPAVRQFLLLGRGKPVVSRWCRGGERHGVEGESVPLHCVRSMVTAVTDLLLAKYAPDRHEAGLVAHIIRLIRALG